ncbi:MAG: DUF3618 domain-containing protein [Actinomycetaceae bacterium]|nr:DUF3618 domain-containing protein [Actinomycetaceae bacterium]
MSEKENKNDPRTVDQIEAELARTRESLTDTVNELAERLSPRTLATDAKDTAVEKATQFAETTKALVEDAKGGDKRAIGIISGVAAAVVLVVALKIARR